VNILVGTQTIGAEIDICVIAIDRKGWPSFRPRHQVGDFLTRLFGPAETGGDGPRISTAK
jgi:hypothetical protein